RKGDRDERDHVSAVDQGTGRAAARARAGDRGGVPTVQPGRVPGRRAARQDQAADRGGGRPRHPVSLLHQGPHQGGPARRRHARGADGGDLGGRRDARGRRLRPLRPGAGHDRAGEAPLRLPDRPAGRGEAAGRASAAERERLTFQIAPAPPFRLDLTVQALRRRAVNAIDRWDGACYRRVLVVDERPLALEVTQSAPAERPLLQVTVRGSPLSASTRASVTAALRRLLGFDRRLDAFERLAARDPRLGELTRPLRGLKPPRFPTLFEALVNAFACQQVTLDLGIQLLNRLAMLCGRTAAPDDPAPAFPSPDDLAGREVDELRALGFSRQKARAMIELAQAVASGDLDLDELERLDDAA